MSSIINSLEIRVLQRYLYLTMEGSCFLKVGLFKFEQNPPRKIVLCSGITEHLTSTKPGTQTSGMFIQDIHVELQI